MSASSYTWTSNNGQVFVTTNPVFTYTANGTYTIGLYTQSISPNCSQWVVHTVTITNSNPCNIAASFIYTTLQNGAVSFTNTSVGTNSNTTYSWNFGDNGTSTQTNPSHTYALNGSYVVTLTASNGGTCSSNATQTITVTSSTCIADASFTLVPTSTPHYWNAYPSYSLNVTNAQWSWGDNSFSNTLYTSHQYSAAGTYDLCLSVTVSCGATDVYCAPYSIYRTSGNSSVVNVNVVDPASVGLNEQSSDTKMTMFPNPTKGAFTVQLSQKTGAFTIANLYDVTGVRVQQNSVAEGVSDINIDASSLPDGIYFLKLETQNTRIMVQKIVIDR